MFFAYFSAKVSPFPGQTELKSAEKGGHGLRKITLGVLLALACALALHAPAALPAGMEEQLALEDDTPMVALTFDDGPRPDTTARLLDELALRQVPATFFLVGSRIPGNEALVQRMQAEGHQVGVHSYSHIFINALPAHQFDFEVGQSRTQLTEVLGEQAFWLRPPYGILDSSVKKRADSPIILWSVDPEDWKDHDVSRITKAVLDKVSDGDIILFHDIYDSSVTAAVQVVDALTARGYSFATARQLLQARGISPENGCVYHRAK